MKGLSRGEFGTDLGPRSSEYKLQLTEVRKANIIIPSTPEWGPEWGPEFLQNPKAV